MPERRAIEADPIADGSKLVRRLPRMLAASATDVDAQFSRERRQAALEGADDAGGDAGRVPVHPHHRAEGLEPEGVSETAQQFVATILEDDRLADDGAQAGHAIAQPFGHPAAVKRQIGAAGASRHQLAPAGGSTDAEVICPLARARRRKQRQVLTLPADGPSKFDTVTPTRRMPFAGGKSDRTRSMLARRSCSWLMTTAG